MYVHHVADCGEGDIHLVGGSVQEGIVVICLGSLWGLVAYDDQWTAVDAQVVCSQLGYEATGIMHAKDSGMGPPFVNSVLNK